MAHHEKISEDTYCSIMEATGTYADIARAVGVSDAVVSKYRRGAARKDLAEKYGYEITTIRPDRLSKQQCFRIYASELPYSALAEEIGFRTSGVSMVRNGRIYKHYYDEYVSKFGKPTPRTKHTRKPRSDTGSSKVKDTSEQGFWIALEQGPLNLPWGPATKPTAVPVECLL